MLKRGRLKLFRRPLGIESGVQAKVNPLYKALYQFQLFFQAFHQIVVQSQGLRQAAEEDDFFA